MDKQWTSPVAECRSTRLLLIVFFLLLPLCRKAESGREGGRGSGTAADQSTKRRSQPRRRPGERQKETEINLTGVSLVLHSSLCSLSTVNMTRLSHTTTSVTHTQREFVNVQLICMHACLCVKRVQLALVRQRHLRGSVDFNLMSIDNTPVHLRTNSL